ncbi:MAG: siroheme synthase CysG [Hyphomicrobiales bacterium]
MRHYPVFLNLRGRRIVVSGAEETALAKLRLLMKTEASIFVFGENPEADVIALAKQNKITLHDRALQAGDVEGAILFYAANDDEEEDARVATIGHAEGALVNVVDNLEASEFITAALVDRDPVTIAIGTEGAAPVLARKIKAEIEAMLPARLGILARIAQAFRPRAELLPAGRARRNFWARFYGGEGEAALNEDGKLGVALRLETLFDETIAAEQPKAGRVSLVGAGPGDPELLTLKARRTLHEADVVLFDRLVSKDILELARREAILVETGKTGFGKGMSQNAINDVIIEHASKGHHVVRLKSGDPAVFGRLDEETEALDAYGISWNIVPGITSASAAAANMGVSLTRRGRNSELRIVTGHDVKGFAEQDWQSLAKPGATAAFYMAKRAARFITGRLMMHGADANTPVTIAFNVSRTNESYLPTTLKDLPEAIKEADLPGPAVVMFGLAPKSARQALASQEQKTKVGAA